MAKSYEIAFALAANTSRFSQSFQTASRSVARLQESFKSFDNAAKQARGLVEMQSRVQASGKAYREAVANVQSLRQAMTQFGPPTRQAVQALEKAQHAADRAKEALQRNAEKMRNLAQAAGMAGAPLRALVARENELTAAVGRASAALARQQAHEARLGRAKAGVVANAPFAQQAGNAVGTGLMAALMDGASLERQLSMVQAITRGSAEDMQKYESVALKLGSSTQFTATQVAEGMQYLAMAGFKTEEVLTAMPGMLDLASAAAVDLGTTADISSNILTGFGLKTEEIGRVGDVLTNTFQHSNTTLVTLGETFKYCAPVAKGFGMSLEDTAAMAGLLGSSGIQASQAGTALRGMLVRLTKEPKQAAAALKELGVKAYDSAGKFKPLQQIFADITQADRWKELSDKGKATALAMIFGTEPLAGAEGLIDALKDGRMQEMLAGQYERGTAAATAKIQKNNLVGDVIELTSALSGLSNILYKSIGSALREVVQHVTGLVSKFNGWLKDNPEVARTIVLVAGGIAAFTAAVLPCIVAVKTIGFAVAALQAGFLLLASPIGLIVLGIGLLIAACVALYVYWDEFKAGAAAVWSALCDSVSSAVGDLGEALSILWDGIKQSVVDAWNSVTSTLSGALAFVTGTFQAGWSAAWNAVSGVFSSIWNGFKGVAQSVLDWIAQKLNSVIGLINSSIEMMNKIPGVDIGKIDQIPTSKTPAMASGGIVTAPTYALVGEAGAEAVMPLDRLSSMLGQYASPGQGAPSGVSLTFSPTINMSGGSSGDPYEAVRRGLSAGADDIKRQLERVLADQRRLSYA